MLCPLSYRGLGMLGDGRDLNPHPPGSQPGALPDLSYRHSGSGGDRTLSRGVRDDGLASRCITVLPHFPIVECRGLEPSHLLLARQALCHHELAPHGDPDRA